MFLSLLKGFADNIPPISPGREDPLPFVLIFFLTRGLRGVAPQTKIVISERLIYITE